MRAFLFIPVFVSLQLLIGCSSTARLSENSSTSEHETVTPVCPVLSIDNTLDSRQFRVIPSLLNNEAGEQLKQGNTGEALYLVHQSIITNQELQVLEQTDGRGKVVITNLDPVYWRNMGALLSRDHIASNDKE